MVIEIHSGDYTALINPQRGANCISLRNSRYNAKILREQNTSGDIDNPFLYGMPILYPVNRISGGQFEFEGRIYKFPINEPATNCHLHGMLHETAFEIIQKGESFIQCAFENKYLDFPHKFRVEIMYSISAEGLMQKTAITNLSDENMPNFLGYHTTFNIPFIEGTKPDDVRLFAEIGDEIERNMDVYLPTGRILPYDEISKKINSGTFIPTEKSISRYYKASGKGRIELIDTKQKVKLVYENDKKFGWRLFYNGNAEEYICLEPMTCMANCPNAPFECEYTGFDSIPPQSTKEYISKIRLEKCLEKENQ